MGVARIGPYRVELSSPGKVLFPDSGITKGELVRYYRDVASFMLPHLEDRPLTLHRYPDGIDAADFYQQEAADYFPDWIETCRVPRAGNGGAPVRHVLCNNTATLVYLANQAAITLHGWLSRAPRLTRPDRLVFDLDPADGDFDAVREAARQVAALMQEIGLTPFAMTTGSRGLHVVAPLRIGSGFDEVRELAREMARRLAHHHAEALTIEQRKKRRRGRIYLDIMRNAYGQTAVAPYAVRALPGAPIATPLALDELGEGRLDPRRWHLKNILRRLGQKGDPWAGIRRHAASAGRARRALRSLQDD
jgi:bifunctional non-homologous end joining protein LigD